VDAGSQFLTVEQAYRAMLVFLEREYNISHSDELGGLLGGLQVLQDGKTADPAAWGDWLDAVRQVLGDS
jgi:hypothetical protein